MKRKQIIVPIIILAISIILGIGSRRFGSYLPGFLAAYTGDTMWALAFFACFRLLFPDLNLWQILLINLDFAFLIELSQLWHPLWLDSLRHTLPGGLLLGFGFLWTDLICYCAGSLLGFVILSSFK
jgi:hypothetical protein